MGYGSTTSTLITQMRRRIWNRKTPKRQPKLSTDSLLKTSKKKKDIELTEEQLGKVSAGYKVTVEYKPQKPCRGSSAPFRAVTLRLQERSRFPSLRFPSLRQPRASFAVCLVGAGCAGRV